MIYDGAFFVMRLSMFGHAHIFFSFIMVCTHLKCYITSDVHLIIYALCEKKWLKELEDKKRKDVIFSSIFFLRFFLAKNIILIYLFWSFD